MKKIILSIDGMTCSACSSGLEKYLNKQDGIKNASVNLVMATANIEYDEKRISITPIKILALPKNAFAIPGIPLHKRLVRKRKSKIIVWIIPARERISGLIMNFGVFTKSSKYVMGDVTKITIVKSA